ncbi:MAG: ATP-binding protein [Ilumatobacteraceae bacterium]
MTRRTAGFDIPAERRSPGLARRKVAQVVDSWGFGALRADAELVVSELITNAIVHAPGSASYELQLSETPTGLRLAVRDGSTSAPVMRSLDDGRPGGRGLRIISTVATNWGYDVLPAGKRIWVDLDQPPASGS